jgi:prepilin-type N-terminal cleavage/methylation domain-containing protein
MASGERGMTLMELLISISLVSLISVGMLMAIRIGFNTQEKTNQHLYDNRRLMAINRIIDSQIGGIMAVTAECVGSGKPAGQIGFFQGEPQSMRFVSSYSLDEAQRGYPRILEFQVIPGEFNQGVRLIVNEHYYNGPISTGAFCIGLGEPPATAPRFLPIVASQRSFVLADKLAYVKMWFREALKEAPYERWVPVWVKEDLPSAIRIEMAPLPVERLRLPLVTITAPVRITRITKESYNELP